MFCLIFRTETNHPMVLPTLFVHIELKTYVPEEFSGFVDALSDPRAYINAQEVSVQEKCEEFLRSMDTDESETIVEVNMGQLNAGSGSGKRRGLISHPQNFDGNVSIKSKQNGTAISAAE